MRARRSAIYRGGSFSRRFFSAGQYLPRAFVDLLIMDPPYNISKNYHGHLFKEKERGKYQDWFSSVLRFVKPLLKPAATIYTAVELPGNGKRGEAPAGTGKIIPKISGSAP